MSKLNKCASLALLVHYDYKTEVIKYKSSQKCSENVCQNHIIIIIIIIARLAQRP